MFQGSNVLLWSSYLCVCNKIRWGRCEKRVTRINQTKKPKPSNAQGGLYFIFIICLWFGHYRRKVTVWKHHASLLQVMKCFTATTVRVIQVYTQRKSCLSSPHFWFHSVSNLQWWLRLGHNVYEASEPHVGQYIWKNTSALINKLQAHPTDCHSFDSALLLICTARRKMNIMHPHVPTPAGHWCRWHVQSHQSLVFLKASQFKMHVCFFFFSWKIIRS